MKKDSSTNSLIRLGDIAGIFAGFSPYGRSPAGKGTNEIPMMMIKNIIDGHVVIADADTVTVEDLRKLDDYQLKPGDVLVTARGSSFRAGVCGTDIVGSIAGSNVAVIRLTHIAPLGPYFLTAMLNAPAGESLLAGLAEGATIQSLKPKTIRELRLSVPEPVKAQEIEELCRCHAELRRASLAAIQSQQNILNGLVEPFLKCA